MIAAGIVTFEPDLERLAQNLRGIGPQVDATIIFDNGSTNSSRISELVATDPQTVLLQSPHNLGIAAALNRLAEFATRSGHEWIVTLDQDSIAPAGMVDELWSVARRFDGAVVTPYIVDINKMTAAQYWKLRLDRVDKYQQAARRGAITSGALTHLATLREIGGFDEGLFIDYVDYDMNQRMLSAGKQILRANHTYLLHEVGRAQRTWLRVPRKDVSGVWSLETFYSFGHSPQRCYYKARNRVIFSRKYGRKIGVSHEGVWQLPQQVLLTVLFERDRWAKLAAFARGFVDGIRADLR